ncbi:MULTISPECIES: phenylacetate--CoA ligase family protein [Pseudonocardia]|uniref:Phenylacetate-coenzyme A ligase PaaK-like adenylate-forming protein n=2 Tax=Pseudonocardia alni TaxID=33907 RepID=A0A852W8D0_PSEA5|nr:MULTISPECIES: phenylacetate--CoA ligase family protein [Pseudonocardia]NYG05447.1 phenylacetate-coenzyme A ligase PaaK-like adenylate-forming protein [Pseudonocardia antarctica]PKB41329.1 phenylacetate-coenzyme A ligase PaaK-like adenylate-forming protein [Pseudonocardia alni]
MSPAGEDGALRLLLDARRTYRHGPEAIDARQRARLAELVDFARGHGSVYRELYQDLPGRVEDPRLLPVTSKAALMARFDDWVTDPRASRERVQAFVADPAQIGQPFLAIPPGYRGGSRAGYTVATTSGTTGTRGMFLLDERALAVTTALSSRMLSTWLNASALPRLIAGRGRLAMVTATGGHFASTAAAARLRRTRRGRRRVQALSVHTPLPELVTQLNAFPPAVLAPYATTAALLATEQQAGRLRIRPALVALAAEGLPDPEIARIATAFGSAVGNSYAATECPFLSYSCHHGWLHVNADWAILEPVDADHRPTPPGQQSHTVLLTNLANRAQSILRYDLGDSVLARPDPCDCGSPLPAIRVQGRTADLLTLPTTHGTTVTLTPLTLSTRLDRLPSVALFQILQISPTELSVRIQPAPGATPQQAWAHVHRELTDLLAAHGLAQITVRRAEQLPQPATGGKYRLVQPLADTPG